MGSSQPPSDPFMPFGYSFDPNQDPPINDPPEPAPGAPLLTDTDNRLLTSFFDDINADHYNMPSFGEGLNFSDTWLDLPPQFMGSSTSFGQQPGSSLGEPPAQGLSHSLNEFHGMAPMGSHMMPPPPPPPSHLQHQTEHRHTPDDVLNAAATLLQNGPNQRQNSNGIDTSVQRHPIGPPVGHLRHQPIEEFREDHRRSVAASEQEHYPDWMMGPHDKRQHRAPPAEYQWGSDANFNRIQGYTPNSEKETAESLTKEQLKVLECFEPKEQKRENHIKSEQKRRTLIKEGFDDLCDLVPGLRGGGFSKSTMLAMAAEWLEDLLKGNEALAAQLAALEGRT
ncbi:hypothetical protein RAB80_006204 [Fusarium oxysporum f. sp. vasinfectum]|nr:hypothetical protein RAB80_006204 [Fusarium oxysporum f. sp. vasinfectum]